MKMSIQVITMKARSQKRFGASFVGAASSRDYLGNETA
jgi:hypothetical protein